MKYSVTDIVLQLSLKCLTFMVRLQRSIFENRQARREQKYKYLLYGKPRQRCEDECEKKKSCIGYYYFPEYCYHYYKTPTIWHDLSRGAYYSRERCYKKGNSHCTFSNSLPFWRGERPLYTECGVEFSHLIVLCIRCCVRQTNANTNCIDSLNKHSIQCIVCFDLRIDSVDK